MPEPDPTATSNRTAQTRRPRRGTAQGGFRADIQALRAIAVAGVVLYHLWPHRLPGGFVGVDVFFVISGYLITSHLLKRPPRTPEFFKSSGTRVSEAVVRLPLFRCPPLVG